MADQRPENRVPVTSDAIERISFRTALRGFDANQVREYLRSVAAHVRALEEELGSLGSRLREAEQRASNPVIEQSQLTSALGEETARILQSAHEAAAEIRGRAEEHVERVVQQAREDGQRLTNEASSILEVRRTAAEAEAAEILRVATDEARRLTEESTAKAKALLEEASATAEKTVEGAKAERAEVLSDVRRRRRVANTQIEQLRAGRERLLQAYDVVRSTLDQVTNELDVADVEAKQAAEEVGRRMNAAIDPLRADALASTPLVDLRDIEPEPPRAVEPPRIVEPPVSRPHRKKGKGARPPLPEPETAPEPIAERVAPEPEPVVVEAPVAEERQPVISDGKDRTEESHAAVVDEVPAEPEPEAVVEEVVVEEVVEEPVVEEEVVVVVDEPVVEEEVVVVEEEPVVEEVIVIEDTRAHDRVMARNETCSALEDHLARRVKRALQDEQNLVLDRLRSVRGTLNADAALGAESEHVTTYVNIVEPALADAARAGAAATGNPIDVPADMIAIVAKDFADELVLPLRRQLDERLHESAAVGDDRITASDRVSAAYREAKTHRAARLAGDWLIAAWATGAYAATRDGATGEWLSDPAKPCCTDCDDNGLAGFVAKGVPFPTGHLHPPAHPGCRCVVVPPTQ